jgi:hypothetical protein
MRVHLRGAIVPCEARIANRDVLVVGGDLVHGGGVRGGRPIGPGEVEDLAIVAATSGELAHLLQLGYRLRMTGGAL